MGRRAIHSTIAAGLVLGGLALAAVAARGPVPDAPPDPPPGALAVPADPAFAAALPGLPRLPERISAAAPDPAPQPPRDANAFGLPCGLEVEARAEPPALVVVRLSDACRPRGRILLRHAGLEIGVVTDGLGAAELRLPALADPARIEILPAADGEDTGRARGRAVTVAIPDLARYHRAAIAWRGAPGLALTAEEPGGPRDAARPGDPAATILGDGGLLHRLGDGPRIAVHTFPRDAAPATVRLSVRLASCGAPVAARVVQIGEDRAAPRDVAIARPPCPGTGAEMVLQNLFRDVRLAALD